MRRVCYIAMRRKITLCVRKESSWNSMKAYGGSLQIMWGRPPGAKSLDDLLGGLLSPSSCAA